MPACQLRNSRFFAAASLLVFAAPGFVPSKAVAQNNGDAAKSSTQNVGQNETPFKLKTSANLVVVRVVVRDAQGKPIENLKKEDFKLFDRDKEQAISQFDVETSSPIVTAVGSAAPSQPAVLASPPSSTAPPGFTLFYFDDLNSSATDLIEARDAADSYVSSRLRPQDRVAIVSSSEVLADFTSDAAALHRALLKLHVSSHSVGMAHNCPDLSDYQAEQIVHNNQEAISVASDEAKNCEGGALEGPKGTPGASSGGGSSGGGSPGMSGGGSGSAIADLVIRKMAEAIVNQTDAQARANLQMLDRVVDYLGQKTGQRTVILVSPGFLSQSAQLQLDGLIDRALRSQVIISALDPKGLAVLMREFDTTRQYVPANNGALLNSAHHMDSNRELAASAVLADVAEGTGGEYFHGSNDLKSGFGALAGSPVSYILAFSPTNLKQDGKFHKLKVTLAEKQKGLTIQARRGYFAATVHEAVARASAPELPPASKEKDAAASAGSGSEKAVVDVNNSAVLAQPVKAAGITSYVDESLPQLTQALPELNGLEPATAQPVLSDLLVKVGAKADELLNKLPDLLSSEAVSETEWTTAPGYNLPQDNRDFIYALRAHMQNNRLVLGESRTDRNGKTVQGEGSPHFQGFVGAWGIFGSANQAESHFRYLGNQKKDGRDTLVLAFAQIPDAVKSAGQIVTSKGAAPLLLQGIAWIDQSDFRIVHLHTDLLASHPEIGFQQQTVNIQFGAATVADRELWLPQAADLKMEANGLHIEEQHRFSQYRLFKVESLVSQSLADQEKQLYAGAHPYIDDALPALKKTVHELGGLKPAADQQQLRDLLVKIGAKADELLQQLPDVVSDERVAESQWTEAQGMPQGCTGMNCGDFIRYGGQEQKFNYIILSHAQNDQQQVFEEYRAYQNGKPIGQGENAPRFQGFASSWVVFSSPNQPESHFRILGEQKIDRHNAYVIGFAQSPGAVGFPGTFLDGRGNSVPMLLQGIAWVDQTDFRIVRLRTDLLAPLTDFGFQEQTSDIELGPVRIADHQAELWLPQEVEVEMHAQGQFLREQHQYSKYRLFQAKTKIVMAPN